MAAPFKNEHYTNREGDETAPKATRPKHLKLSKEPLKDSNQYTLTVENRDPAENKKAFVKFVKLTKNAFTPVKGSIHSAGHDLFSANDCIIPPGDKGIIVTDIAIELPKGCYGRIAPRSGLAINHSLHTLGGVIDRDYRGTITVILMNFGSKVYYVKRGDKVAQLILEKIYYPNFIHVGSLNATDRGDRGFGSTGKGNRHYNSLSKK